MSLGAILHLCLCSKGIAKKHKDQDSLINGGLEGADARVTQREQDGRNNMQARVAESGNGKLDH